MDKRFTLRGYPYVVVRIRCDECNRSGGFRLASLVEKLGADFPLDRLVQRLAHPTCGRLPENRRGKGRYLDVQPCAARLFDLDPPQRTPDLPSTVMPVRERVSNYEHRPKRRTATLQEIRDQHRWYDFHLFCTDLQNCGHQAHIEGDKFDGSLTLDDLQDRFVCSKCGNKKIDLRVDMTEFGRNRRLARSDV